MYVMVCMRLDTSQPIVLVTFFFLGDCDKLKFPTGTSNGTYTTTLGLLSVRIVKQVETAKVRGVGFNIGPIS